MKTVFLIVIKIMTVIIIVILTTITIEAQPNLGGPGTNNSGENANGTSGTPSPTVPFDGGMSIMLIASGISYGVKKLRNK